MDTCKYVQVYIPRTYQYRHVYVLQIYLHKKDGCRPIHQCTCAHVFALPVAARASSRPDVLAHDGESEPAGSGQEEQDPEVVWARAWSWVC